MRGGGSSSSRAAIKPGPLYKFPWEALGSWKSVLLLPLAWRAVQLTLVAGTPCLLNIQMHLLLQVALRYLHFQIWYTVSQLPCISRKHRIQTKPLTFDQLDHEATWDNMIFLNAYMQWAVVELHVRDLWGRHPFPLFNLTGVFLCFLFHLGPVEWVYYWVHRFLHHHSLFTRYHSHHHSSFVTQPITSSNHPFLEHALYFLIFFIAFGITYFAGYGSIGLLHIYILYIDFMNAWGHCNFEFIPTHAYKIFPPLKYLVYSPTFHSLHHSRVHTNYSLFVPLYDYLYGTADETTQCLHQTIRQGRTERVDCVYLTHMIGIFSPLHSPYGIQTFASQPYKPAQWYICLMWPVAAVISLFMWLFANPFIATIHQFRDQRNETGFKTLKDHLEIHSWVIPRYNIHYHMEFEKSTIDGWIEDCVYEAQQIGAKVVALGLLNKTRNLDAITLYKDTKIPIVTGETLTAALVIKRIISQQVRDMLNIGKLREDCTIFLTSANTRIGQAIATYFCEQGTKILALCSSRIAYNSLRAKVGVESQNNLIYAREYKDGSKCKTWVVGEQIGIQEQQWVPIGAHIHLFTLFPISKCRSDKDCSYGPIPCLKLPDYAKGVHTCEDVMPRYVVRACYAAAILHVLERLHHHDFVEDISLPLMEATWEAALKHGFSPCY